ncbi:MAG: tRNA (adenosine(37)-N6)-threonylcarbamoyltransferase complex ATPase subunit type 1 TsaE [Bacteroidales bacterium]|nr:tRNA (adenosine(37)-N6)-threonylcarbamoyltransferase complex ATPase subunit type 1 TsaE [Bacteroidales bacterium]
MNKETIYIENLNAINIAAQDFIKKIKNKKVFAFYGEMGAGKTTFIKAICENLGVEDMINSPTFSIVNEYLGADGNIIYHMDCYRIEKESEATDIGVTGYLYSGNYCFIEWPEKIKRLLPDDMVKVKIAETENGIRIVEFEV